MTHALAQTGIALDAPVKPAGLLLDFGGVLFLTSKPEGGFDRWVEWTCDLCVKRGIVGGIEYDDVRAALEAGIESLSVWKDNASREEHPRELTQQEMVKDHIAPGLRKDVAELLISESGDLLDAMSLLRTGHQLREGVVELLELAKREGIPVAIVSNAHSGRSHRRVLKAAGISHLIDAEFYSDEVGVRKPNPAMIDLAATALGAGPEQCWFVGDTLDRDVQAARRAGVGAVYITTSQHTDNPPFDVADEADAIVADPRAIAQMLARACGTEVTEFAPARMIDVEPPSTGATVEVKGHHPGALLIDHGGVISSSVKSPALADFANKLAAKIGVDGEDLLARIKDSKATTSALKRQRDAEFRDTGDLPEMDPRWFWADVVGADYPAHVRANLRGLAVFASEHYGYAKSERHPRAGIREALQTAVDEGMRVVVVSNTISGRAVRAAVAKHGLDDLVAGYVCSDEYGIRKPHPDLFKAALRMADADPQATVFLGDKPRNDADGAALAQIAHRVIVRGGAIGDADIDAAARAGRVTATIDEPGELSTLLKQLH